MRKHEQFTQDEEYGEMQVIYITEAAKRQMERGEGWWKPFPFATAPDDRYRIKTVAPKQSLEKDACHPDRYEPERMLEWCEDVPESTLKRTRPRPFRKGDRVSSTLHGPGDIVTDGYAGGTVSSVRDGRVRVRWDGEREDSPLVFHPETGEEVEQAFPGMHSKIALLTEEKKSAKPKSRPKRERRRK